MPIGFFAGLCVVAAVAIPAAYLAYRCIERPGIRLGHVAYGWVTEHLPGTRGSPEAAPP